LLSVTQLLLRASPALGRPVFVWALGALFPVLLPAQQGGLPAPALRAGQTLIYRLEFSASRATQTESRLSGPPLPPGDELKAVCLLQVEVVEAHSSGFRLKTYLSERTAPSLFANPPAVPSESAPDKIVEVSVARNGAASQIKGLEQLSVAQQFAWNTWLGRFTSTWTDSHSRVHVGSKWELDEPETTPSPLTSLVWAKKYQYVRSEPCGPANKPATDNCAVVLVRAQLRQKSSPNHATPKDFNLHGMVTRGTATGANETILYIGLATGLLVRSSEDAQQSMDATIALADGSNEVRYVMKAKSRSQIQLVRDFSLQPH
jgi:hypothetical protein